MDDLSLEGSSRRGFSLQELDRNDAAQQDVKVAGCSRLQQKNLVTEIVLNCYIVDEIPLS